MKIFATKFLIDAEVAHHFKEICDDLALKKDSWACFFIQFELDLLSAESSQFQSNSKAALKQIEATRKKVQRSNESIKVPPELLTRIDEHCKLFNFTRPMLVEFALRNASERMQLDRKLSKRRADLSPLYRLERSASNRKTRTERINLIKNNLVVGTIRQSRK